MTRSASMGSPVQRPSGPMAAARTRGPSSCAPAGAAAATVSRATSQAAIALRPTTSESTRSVAARAQAAHPRPVPGIGLPYGMSVRRLLLALVTVALVAGATGCGDSEQDKKLEAQAKAAQSAKEGPFGYNLESFEEELTRRGIDLVPADRTRSELNTAPGPLQFGAFDTPEGS